MRPTTMIWPASPKPAQPLASFALRRTVGIGLAVILVVGGVVMAYSGWRDQEATAREAARTARALGSFPVSNRIFMEACARRGVAIASCLASENALRTKAETLWTEAPLDSRKSCLDAAEGAEEPVRKLYVCLALLR